MKRTNEPPEAARLKIHEIVNADDGTLRGVFLSVEDGGALMITSSEDDGRSLELPDNALDAVMKRYAAPLDTAEHLVRVAKLDLGDGHALHHVRHLARYDVIARDYLLYEVHGGETLCALATVVTGALTHLAKRAAQQAQQRHSP